MQILKSLLTFALVLAGIGIVGLFLTREILLVVTLNQVTTDFQQLDAQVKTGNFLSNCTRLGSFNNQGSAQLRFLDQRTYVLEVTCENGQANPVIVKKQALPVLATKVYGDSGLTGNGLENHLEFRVLGRSGLVNHLETGELSWSYGHLPADQPLNGPPTACAGYGLTCCQESEEQGTGRAIQGAIDCPKSCYESCVARPVILGFNTEPFYDLTTRTLVTQAGQDVTFSYVVSESQVDTFADTPIKDQKNVLSILLAGVQSWFQSRTQNQTALQQVTIKFGDGQETQLAGAQGTTTHAYTCQTVTCTYTASIKAVNRQGAEAQDTRFNTVTVTVTQ